MNRLRELQLGIVQRDERHLDPVDPCRDDDFAAEILEVSDGAGCAVHPEIHRHVTHRAGGHHRAAGDHAAAIAAGVLIIAAEPGEAFFRQSSGVPLERVQHAVQRRNIKRPVSTHDRLSQGGAADLNLVLQFAIGVEQEQLARRADANHPLGHKHDGCARRDSQFVLPLQFARLVQSVDFAIRSAKEDVAKHIGDRLAKDHSTGIEGPLLHALLDADQLVQRPGWRIVAPIAPIAVAAFGSHLGLPCCAEINQVLVVHRRGGHHAFARQLECPQCLAKRIQRIQLGVVAGDEDGVVGGDRRGGGHPAPGLKGPLDQAILAHGVNLVIERADINGAVRPDGRGGTLHTGTQRGDPFQCAKGVQRIQFAVAGGHVNRAVHVNRRCRCNRAADLEGPLQ